MRRYKKLIGIVIIAIIVITMDVQAFADTYVNTSDDKQSSEATADTIVYPINSIMPVTLNGKNIDFPDAKPIFDKDGIVKAPVRFLAEALGAKTVQWDGANKKVTVVIGDKSIDFKIGDNIATVDGKACDMSAVAIMNESRSYVPVSWFAQELGYKVDWDGKNCIMNIIP